MIHQAKIMLLNLGTQNRVLWFSNLKLKAKHRRIRAKNGDLRVGEEKQETVEVEL